MRKKIIYMISTTAIGIIIAKVLFEFCIVKGENNIRIENYSRSEQTEIMQGDKEEKSNIKYKHTYIDMKKSLIRGHGLRLEGVIIDKYTYQINDVLFETTFGKDKFEVLFGVDHPNGYRLLVYNQEYGYNLYINTRGCDNFIIDDYGEITEGAMVQISPYDFDLDGNNELIVCIRNGIEGICSVFSYTHVGNIKKLNPFKQELCVDMQSWIFLDKNLLQTIVGSANRVANEYKYIDEQFMEIIN